MRVVHVVNGSAASSATSLVGIERHVLNLAVAQKARGYSVGAVIDCPGMLAEACHQHGIPVVVAQGLAPQGRLGEPPTEKASQELVAQFRSLDAELIHCHTLPAASQAIPVGNRFNIPCVLTFNAPSVVIAAKKAGMRFATILVSRTRFEELKKSGMPEADIYYVPNGTNAASLAPAPEARQPHRPNLISVGSLIPRKGIDVAILAMVELRQRLGQDCPTLNIYGDGDLGEFLKEIVAVLGLNDIVWFRGFQFNILEHCSSTDVLVMSSRAETGPQVVLEAMSRGMPIVASDVGEVSEMLADRRYGRIVPVDSIVALADAVESLLSDIADGQFNPDLLIERHRANYTVEKMAESIEAVYKQALMVNR